MLAPRWWQSRNWWLRSAGTTWIEKQPTTDNGWLFLAGVGFWQSPDKWSVLPILLKRNLTYQPWRSTSQIARFTSPDVSRYLHSVNSFCSPLAPHNDIWRRVYTRTVQHNGQATITNSRNQIWTRSNQTSVIGDVTHLTERKEAIAARGYLLKVQLQLHYRRMWVSHRHIQRSQPWKKKT